MSREAMDMKRNIFVIGLDAFNHRLLNRMGGAQDYSFHELLSFQEVKGDGDYPVKEALQ